MRNKLTKWIIASSFAMIVSAYAGPAAPKGVIEDVPPPVAVQDEPCYKAGELSVDAFAFYADPDNQNLLDDGFGAGVGVNYFFNRYLGVGGDYFVWDGGSEAHNFTASLIARLPLESESFCWAPYVFGGGGYHTNAVKQGTGHAGAGLDFRVAEEWSVFTDARFTWADDTDDYNIYKLGARRSF